MKLQKLKQDNLTDAGALIVGASAGAMLSDGVVGILPVKHKTIVRAGIVLTGAAGVAALKGDDLLTKGVKATLAGMAIQQTVKLVRENVQKVLPQNDGKKINKFLHDAFGNGGALPAPSTTEVTAPGTPFTFDPDRFPMASPFEQPISEFPMA